MSDIETIGNALVWWADPTTRKAIVERLQNYHVGLEQGLQRKHSFNLTTGQWDLPRGPLNPGEYLYSAIRVEPYDKATLEYYGKLLQQLNFMLTIPSDSIQQAIWSLEFGRPTESKLFSTTDMNLMAQTAKTHPELYKRFYDAVSQLQNLKDRGIMPLKQPPEVHLANVVWTIRKRPEEAKEYIPEEEYWGKEPPVNLKAIVWPTPFTLIFEVDGVYREVPIKPDSIEPEGITLGNLLGTIYNFYQAPLTQKDADEFKTLGVGIDYDPKNPPTWVDLVGDHIYYEGITLNPETNIATINLGS